MLLLGQVSGTPPWWVARWCSPLGKVLPLGQEKVLPLGGWAGAPPWAGRREVRQILRYRHCPTLGAPTLQLGPILGLAPIKICYFSDASQKDKKKSPIRSGIFSIGTQIDTSTLSTAVIVYPYIVKALWLN